MGFLTNSWIRYFDRTYQQIKTQVLTDLSIFTPEITDHTEGNPLVKALGIWSGIAEMLGYYIDNAAREAFLDSCRRYESAVKISKLMDYPILGCSPASVDVTFTINSSHGSDIVIPAGTVVANSTGLQFYTTGVITIIAGQTSATGSVLQAVFVNGATLGVSTGVANMSFIVGTNIVAESVSALVNSVGWTQVSTFAFSGASDQHYVMTVDENKNIIVKFGDGESGAIPANGLVITSNHRTTSGLDGNVDANTITQIVSSLTLPVGKTITVTNSQRATGGSGVEDLVSLKKRIPLYLRTLRRAVTGQDYIDVAEQMAGVAKAGYVFDCGKTVDLYVVPTGGGIASGALLSQLVTWFEDKRMVTTRVRSFSAGEVRVLLVFDLYVLPNYQGSVVTNAVMNNLLAFLSVEKQKIAGAVRLADVYEVIERTEGVNYSQINQLGHLPYARPLDTTTPQLTWTRNVQTGSTGTNRWKIQIISSTTYQLLKNGVFVNIYTIGSSVIQPEVNFTVNAGAYSVGNQWEFVTYKYDGSLVLEEPSIPISLNANININTIGGL